MQRGKLKGRGPRPDGWPLICDECGRETLPLDEQVQWWLDGIKNNVRTTRCPQHITTWAIREAGLPRSKSTYRWARAAKEQDPGDPGHKHLNPIFDSTTLPDL